MVPQTCKVCDHECENLCTQYTHVGPSYNPANAAFLGLCLLRPWTLEQVACALWGQNMGWAAGWAPCAGDRVYNTAPRLPSLLRFNCPASAKGNLLPVFPCLLACLPAPHHVVRAVYVAPLQPTAPTVPTIEWKKTLMQKKIDEQKRH